MGEINKDVTNYLNNMNKQPRQDFKRYFSNIYIRNKNGKNKNY